MPTAHTMNTLKKYYHCNEEIRIKKKHPILGLTKSAIIYGLILSSGSITLLNSELNNSIDWILLLFFSFTTIFSYWSIKSHANTLLSSWTLFISLVIMQALTGVQLGYSVLHLSAHRPLIDDILVRTDRIMGFNWKVMLTWFNNQPDIVDLLYNIYKYSGIILLLSMIILLIHKKYHRVFSTLSGSFISLIVIHICGYFWPALGAYAYLGITPDMHSNINLFSEGDTAVHVMLLRTDPLATFAFSEMMGLMTFPSFHICLAVLTGWALWPYRWLRIPVGIYCALLAPATLLHGSHHLSDIIVGAILCGAAIWLACYSAKFFQSNDNDFIALGKK